MLHICLYYPQYNTILLSTQIEYKDEIMSSVSQMGIILLNNVLNFVSGNDFKFLTKKCQLWHFMFDSWSGRQIKKKTLTTD